MADGSTYLWAKSEFETWFPTPTSGILIFLACYTIYTKSYYEILLQTTTTAPCNGDAAGLNCTTIDETFNDNLCDPSNAATAELRVACCDYCANKPTPPTTTTGKAW